MSSSHTRLLDREFLALSSITIDLLLGRRPPNHTSAQNTGHLLLSHFEQQSNRKGDGTDKGNGRPGNKPELHADVFLLAHVTTPVQTLVALSLSPGAVVHSGQALADEAASAAGLGTTVLASPLVHALAVAGAVARLVHAALLGGETLRNRLLSGGLQRTLSRAGDGRLGRGVRSAADGVVGDDGLGVEAAAEIGGAGGGFDAPLVELGGPARLGHEDEEGLEVAGGDELVETAQVIDESIKGLGRLLSRD